MNGHKIRAIGASVILLLSSAAVVLAASTGAAVVTPFTAAAHNFLTGFNGSGVPQAAQPASTDLSDSAAVARLASPTFTGTPAAPTATTGTNTTQIASTQFVQTALASAGSSILTPSRFVTLCVNHADQTTPSWVNTGSPSTVGEFGTTLAWTNDSDAEYRSNTSAAVANTDIALQAGWTGAKPLQGLKWGVQYKPTATASFRECIGMFNGNGFDDADATATEGTGFQFSTARGDTNWKMVTCDNGGVSNIQDTGVARTATTAVYFSADESVNGTVTFYINGAQVGTSTTHLRSNGNKTFQCRIRPLTGVTTSQKVNAFVMQSN